VLSNGKKAKAILDLYDEMKRTVPEVTRSQYAVAAIDAIFGTPVFIPSEFHEQTGIPKKTANRILQQLREHDIIAVLEEGGGRRGGDRGGAQASGVRGSLLPHVP